MNRFTALRSDLANLYLTQGDARCVITSAGLNLAYIQFIDQVFNNWRNILYEVAIV